MKKHTFILGNFLIALLFIGISYAYYHYQPAVQGQRKIGVTYMTMNNSFYSYLNSQIKKVTDEKGDVLLLRDPAMDSSKQAEQVNDFVDQQVDALIINPVNGGDNKRLQAAVRRAKKSGIKVVALDSQITDNLADTTVVSDNYHAGVLLGKHLMGSKSSATIYLLAHENTYSADERLQGFKDTLSGYKAYQIVGQANAQGQTELAMPLTEKALAKNPKINTIMAINDRSAIGALAALENLNLSKNTAVYSVDGSPDIKSLISKKDNNLVTVAQFPTQMANQSITAAYKLLDGKKVEKTITIPVKLVDKDNISHYNLTGWE
ncbi:substrate-binding domain-containing protein [Streptococcus dentapri]|uniref:Substrate-binding domain-containing protein n=1 Tax=Streptococcus dentapri TaxID=573564 RepID=A0ABV8D0W1_9STRE